MQEVKEELFKHCEKFVQHRHEQILKQLSSIRESLLSETKSSAGDKHETGRAMLQLEREKAGIQLKHILQVKVILDSIRLKKSDSKILLGSLVSTSQGNYFLSISAGSLTIDKTNYFTLTCDSPLGKIFLGKESGDIVQFRNQKIKILAVD